VLDQTQVAIELVVESFDDRVQLVEKGGIGSGGV